MKIGELRTLIDESGLIDEDEVITFDSDGDYGPVTGVWAARFTRNGPLFYYLHTSDANYDKGIKALVISAL